MARPIIPEIRVPEAGYIRIEASVDCASCGRRDVLAAKGPMMAAAEARELGWKTIRQRWFCPVCVAGAPRG